MENFLLSGGEQGRYVLSLCVDFFNPYSNKQAGEKGITWCYLTSLPQSAPVDAL